MTQRPLVDEVEQHHAEEERVALALLGQHLGELVGDLLLADEFEHFLHCGMVEAPEGDPDGLTPSFL